ncbi:hypothetical protein ACLOJK_036255 [Asimina triloba]
MVGRGVLATEDNADKPQQDFAARETACCYEDLTSEGFNLVKELVSLLEEKYALLWEEEEDEDCTQLLLTSNCLNAPTSNHFQGGLHALTSLHTLEIQNQGLPSALQTLIIRKRGACKMAPQFKFVHRRNVVLSIDTDKTNEEDLLRAVTKAKALLEPLDCLLTEYTSYADTSSIPGHYVLFWELKMRGSSEAAPEIEGSIMEECCREVEESLDAVYRRSRAHDKSIGPLEIRVVKHGAFDALMDFCLSGIVGESIQDAQVHQIQRGFGGTGDEGGGEVVIRNGRRSASSVRQRNLRGPFSAPDDQPKNHFSPWREIYSHSRPSSFLIPLPAAATLAASSSHRPAASRRVAASRRREKLACRDSSSCSGFPRTILLSSPATSRHPAASRLPEKPACRDSSSCSGFLRTILLSSPATSRRPAASHLQDKPACCPPSAALPSLSLHSRLSPCTAAVPLPAPAPAPLLRPACLQLNLRAASLLRAAAALFSYFRSSLFPTVWRETKKNLDGDGDSGLPLHPNLGGQGFSTVNLPEHIPARYGLDIDTITPYLFRQNETSLTNS